MTESRSTQVIAHRGASADHPENTVAAFRAAAEQGADWVELDARLTADGALVVCHDPDYPGGGEVGRLGAADRPAGVPLLEEALAACAGMGVNVEIKNSPGDLGQDPPPWSTEVADLVVAALRRMGPVGPAGWLVSSFDWTTLERVRELEPSLPTAFLVLDLNADLQAPERAAAAGHVALHPWDPFVDGSLLARCHALGLACNTWTVDDPDRIAELGRLGVDGVVTNVPALARRALGG